jgi:hypothetical protein
MKVAEIKQAFGQLAQTARRHDKVLSVTGAAIVFLTFFVKEQVHDHVEKQLNALNEAQTFLNLQGEIQALNFQFEKQIATSLYWLDPKSAPVGQSRQALLAELFTFGFDVTDTCLRRLDGTLNYAQQARVSDKSIQSRGDDTRKKCQVINKDNVAIHAGAPPLSAKNFPEYVSRSEFQLEMDNEVAASDIGDLKSDIQTRVENRKLKEEALESLTYILSLVLFVLGWLVGLAGKIAGAGDSNE